MTRAASHTGLEPAARAKIRLYRTRGWPITPAVCLARYRSVTSEYDAQVWLVAKRILEQEGSE